MYEHEKERYDKEVKEYHERESSSTKHDGNGSSECCQCFNDGHLIEFDWFIHNID
jgi:hypothetical protein